MKKIIVCTPYFKDIGGTELEALNSAIFLKKENKEIEVYIFTPKKEVHPFFVQELSKYNIKLFTYPFFFYLKHFRRFKGLLESLFWVLKSMTNKYSFYILGYLPAVYFFPILLVKRSNKVLKLTMNHFDTIPEDHFKYYDKLTKIIVFNKFYFNISDFIFYAVKFISYVFIHGISPFVCSFFLFCYNRIFVFLYFNIFYLNFSTHDFSF